MEKRAVDLAQHICLVRGHRVMLDSILADLYGVETRVLIQAVKRNRERFPQDFCFQVEPHEAQVLKSQIVRSSRGHGGRRTSPFAFTEQGVAMLSSVLRSGPAIALNIEIMRAFVRLREVLAANKELARQFTALEARIDKRLADQDLAIADIMRAIRTLISPDRPTKPPIGFVRDEVEKRN